MKHKQKIKKILFPTLVSLTALTVGVSITTSLGAQLKQINQTAKNQAKIDPVQARVQKAMYAGIGAKASGLVATRYASASDDTNLSSYVGQDIAKIGLENVFTNGGTNSTSGSVYHQEARPNTGVIVVNTNVTSTDGKNTQANAYDYVNLKYVQYNKTTGTLTDVLSAPPPGLFTNNLWPNWTPSSTAADNDANSTIDLNVVFPTQTILNAVKTTFGFSTNTVTKTEWFAKTNSQAFSLDLSSLFINTIAEIFNPNLIWGFGIYDLHTQVINTLSGAKAPNAANEILYNGLYRIIANNNSLDYFPNPQFENMPALRYIQASRNKIKAIGDFASYQNGDLGSSTIQADKVPSYFLYLQSLWTNANTKNYPVVAAIQKWLMTSLPAKYMFTEATESRSEASRRPSGSNVFNQLWFQIVISANNVYFPSPNGGILTTKTPNNSSIPDSSGSWGDLNFASVLLNVSKNLYQIDFSHNQIEQFHRTRTKFTYLNFSNNKLRYVPPIALQPLPWNYLATAVQPASGANPPGPRKSGSTFLNTAQWVAAYQQNNSDVSTPITQSASIPITQKLLAPSLQFNNNQILDWWPNNFKTDTNIINDGWYTWPNTTKSAVQGEPPVVNTIASTRAQAIFPYSKSTYSNDNYSAYLHRNFLTSRPEGKTYEQSSANLLGDWKNSGYTDGNDAHFYRYYFANKDDNIELVSQQNFTTQLNFNLFDTETSKQKSFVLPGYETSGNATLTTIGTFNQGLKPSASKNVTVNRYYDNLVPYLLGRTLPQNWTTLNSWISKKLNVELLGGDGKNLLPAFTNLDSLAIFNSSNSGIFSGEGNEFMFVKQILGALPSGNGTYNNKVVGDTNVSEGIARNLFANQSRVILNIKQQDLGLNYSYVINVLKNLNYMAEALNPKNSDKTTEDITASTFTKKDHFAIASQISARDLLNELASWLKTSDYVNLYLLNNPNALTIRSYDIQKGELQVHLNVNDVNGNPVTLSGLNNNTITITGFTTLGSSFIDDSGAAITAGETAKLDAITNSFLPKDNASVLDWIYSHYQVNYFGLTLKDNTNVTSGPDSTHPGGYYKLNELQNPQQYITNLNVQANSGALSFTVIIPANAANANTPLSKTETLTSFLKFGMVIDTSSFDPASKQAVYDYQQKPELLKKFVKFAPTRTLNNGTLSTTTAVPWIKTDAPTAQTDAELQAANLIPKYAKLEVVVAASSDPTTGILNFNVNLLDNSTPETKPLPVLNTQSKTLFGLYNYDSEFSLNGASTMGSSGVRYINDTTKASSTASQLNDILKGYATANNQSDFGTWIQPLVDFSKSDQTYTAAASGSSGTWTASALSEEQKKQLVYGFGTNASFSATDLQDNVSFDTAANTLSINNLSVKGGYLNGHFYKGADADAPVTSLGSSVYSFFLPKTTITDFGSYTPTTPASSSLWTGSTYNGSNTYFQAGFNQWKDMLPSEWVARLLSLKNANRNHAVDSSTYEPNNFNSLFSFLNHVINTSTSNSLFKTMVDVNNITAIQVNDFAGTVTIPVNTLLVLNYYKNETLTTPDAQPFAYNKEIKFRLSDYTKRLSDDIKNTLPWKSNAAVNAQFQAIDPQAVKDNLDSLLAAAKKLYDSASVSENDQAAAFTAIEILAGDFIADEYYTQPDASAFFTQKFGDAAPDAKKNEYTQFQSITYSNLDPVNGVMAVTVTLKNYISNYNETTRKYELTDKVKTFQLTNLLRHFGTPIWNNGSDTNPKQTAVPQAINLATTAPELNLFQPGTDTPIFSYQTVTRTDFNTYTAQEYYDHLMSDSSKQLSDYIKLGPDGLQFANWAIVDNYGIPQENLKDGELDNLVEKIKDAQIVIKKSNIRFSTRTNQIYFIDPLIHFTGTYSDLVAKQKAMANIFDPLRNSVDHVPFGADQNFKPDSLPNITLVGFAKVPTKITAKTSVNKIHLGKQTYNLNEILPSQIYEWIESNYSNFTELYNLFSSFYNLTGTSDLQKPVTITLNPEIVTTLTQANHTRGISSWVSFNDGVGTINFKDVFFIFNTFENKDQATPTETTVAITKFMPANSKDEFSLNNLKKSSFQSVEANKVVQAKISSNLKTAISQLEQNNFRLAHELLVMNEIKTNLVNDESQLEINNVTSNLQSGELVIHYTVRNTYANGQRTNMSGVYILSNFYSPLVPFLQAGLTPLLIGLTVLFLGIHYINRRYRYNMNTRKYTRKKITNKKG